MTVPVTVQVCDFEPTLDLLAWDHGAETDLDVPSGRIVIAGCTDYWPDAARVDVERGRYRVRVSYGDLNTLSSDGLEGKDHYRVQFWQTLRPESSVRILKERSAKE